MLSYGKLNNQSQSHVKITNHKKNFLPCFDFVLERKRPVIYFLNLFVNLKLDACVILQHSFALRTCLIICDSLFFSFINQLRPWNDLFRLRLQLARFLGPPILWSSFLSLLLSVFLSAFLSFFLSFCLPFSGRKLKISVNIDARTLKFCMNHPWTQS